MEDLIIELKKNGVLKDTLVEKAFLSVDRKDFVLKVYESEAYGNYPLPIGADQTISQPYTVAFMLDLLSPRDREKILDVGSGSGWTTALLASIVGENGQVFGVEIIPELVRFGQNNLAKYNFPWASIRKARNGVGLREKAPFDKILVSASGENLPKELLDQLKDGGIMVMPVKNEIWRIKKISADRKTIKKFDSFAFVPLITR